MAAVIVLAAIAGWYTARYRRARADLTGAKDGITKARQILNVERKMFALIAGIVVIAVWWWLDSHT